MTLHSTRIDDFVAEQIQDMLQTRFAMHDPHLDPLNPTLFIVLFHLTVHQALWPAQLRPRWAAPLAGAGRRIAMSKGVQDGRLIALIGIGKECWQMPRTETLLGIVHQSPGLLLSPFADDERYDQFALGSNGRMASHVPCLCALLHPATLLLFF